MCCSVQHEWCSGAECIHSIPHYMITYEAVVLPAVLRIRDHVAVPEQHVAVGQHERRHAHQNDRPVGRPRCKRSCRVSNSPAARLLHGQGDRGMQLAGRGLFVAGGRRGRLVPIRARDDLVAKEGVGGV